jgi:hypothetical protein
MTLKLYYLIRQKILLLVNFIFNCADLLLLKETLLSTRNIFNILSIGCNEWTFVI